MAHLFVEFRDDANVESQVGVMLTFIHSCGSKGGGGEGLRERGWGRENEWTNKNMKSKKSRNK